jgi:hypothetical protein
MCLVAVLCLLVTGILTQPLYAGEYEDTMQQIRECRERIRSAEKALAQYDAELAARLSTMNPSNDEYWNTLLRGGVGAWVVTLVYGDPRKMKADLLSLEMKAQSLRPSSNYNPTLNYSYGQPGGSCFIATAAYGTPDEPEVLALREFRDVCLLKNPIGQLLVGMYYAASPPLAELVAKSPQARAVTRHALRPVVSLATLATNSVRDAGTAVQGPRSSVSQRR